MCIFDYDIIQQARCFSGHNVRGFCATCGRNRDEHLLLLQFSGSLLSAVHRISCLLYGYGNL